MSTKSDADEVKVAVAAYHAALSSLDPAKIQALWAHEDSVTTVEPASEEITVGWTAVKKGLDGFFGGFSELKVAQAVGPHVQVWGDVACSTGVTTAAARTKAGESLSLRVCDTQVLVKRGGAWRVVSNIALPVPH